MGSPAVPQMSPEPPLPSGQEKGEGHWKFCPEIFRRPLRHKITLVAVNFQEDCSLGISKNSEHHED